MSIVTGAASVLGTGGMQWTYRRRKGGGNEKRDWSFFVQPPRAGNPTVGKRDVGK